MPVTVEQFFDVFARYNTALGWAPLLVYAWAVALAFALHRGGLRATRRIAGSLAILWAAVGIGYQWIFFAPVNPAAWWFGGLFVLQAALLAHAAYATGDWGFARSGWRAALGYSAIAYALVVYPLLGLLSGHVYPRVPLPLVAPCPLAIFTLGVLLVAARAPRRLFVVPILWSAIGGSAAWLLGVPEDFGLIAAGILSLITLLATRRKAAIV